MNGGAIFDPNESYRATGTLSEALLGVASRSLRRRRSSLRSFWNSKLYRLAPRPRCGRCQRSTSRAISPSCSFLCRTGDRSTNRSRGSYFVTYRPVGPTIFRSRRSLLRDLQLCFNFHPPVLTYQQQRERNATGTIQHFHFHLHLPQATHTIHRDMPLYPTNIKLQSHLGCSSRFLVFSGHLVGSQTLQSLD